MVETDEALNELVEHCTNFTCREWGQDISMYVPRSYHMSAAGTYLQEVIREFLHTAESRLRKIDYIVDIGAHVGLWTIPFAVHFPDADILAFEPSKYNRHFLLKNVEPYGDRITVRDTALGNMTNSVKLALPTPVQKKMPRLGDTGQMSIFGLSDRYRELVKIAKLDDIIERKADWIKIDVEGAEKLVLLGAQGTIMRDRPILQVEMREANQSMGNCSVWELLDLITRRMDYFSIGEIRGDLIFLPNEHADAYTANKPPY